MNVTSQAGDACSTNAPPAPGNYGCPTGTITLTDNGSPLGAGAYPLNSQGYAEDQSVFLTGGTNSISANYPGDTGYTDSGPTANAVVITKAPTTIALGAPSAPGPFVGSYVSITATVNTQVLQPPAADLPSTATGAVQFFVDSTPIQPGTDTSVTYSTDFTSTGYAQLTATLFTNTLTAAAHTITAQYNGDGNYAESPVSSGQTIHPVVSTALSLQSQNPTPLAGTSVLFTATINPSQQLSSAPTGTIVFTIPNETSQSQTISNNEATASFTMPAGVVYVEAQYQGDSNYAGSDTSITEVVTAIPTSVTVTSSNQAPQVGTSVTYTASVSNTQTNTLAPTGTVNFNIAAGGAFLGGAQVVGGQASITSASLPAGVQAVSATYLGDTYHPVTTGLITETVSLGTSTTSLSSSALTIPPGTNVTFRVQVSGASIGAPIPTGNVQFTANGASLGTVSLANGTAQVSTSTLALGSVSIVATYSGDSNYTGSTATLTETVAVTPAFSVTASPSALTISAPGQSVSTTLTLTSQGSLSGSGGFSSSTCGTAASEEITCSLSSFTLPANGTATATLTFSSTAASGVAPASRKKPTAPVPNAPRTTLLILICALFALAFAQRRKDHRWQFALAAVLFVVLFASASCGGGSSSGGGGTGPTNPGTPAGTVSPLSVSITINGTTQTVPGLSLTVQ